MDTSTYFDLIPDELIILIFTYTRSNINISNRLNNLYTVFINNIKKGLVNPDDVFVLTSDAQDFMVRILYYIRIIKKRATHNIDCYLQLNNNDTKFDTRTSSKSGVSYEQAVRTSLEKNIPINVKLSVEIREILMGVNKIYLWIENNNYYTYSSTIDLVLSNKENFLYVRIKYDSLLESGNVMMKTEKSWKKFYTEILDNNLRNHLLIENRYII